MSTKSDLMLSLRIGMILAALVGLSFWVVWDALHVPKGQRPPWQSGRLEQRIETQPALSGVLLDRTRSRLAYPNVRKLTAIGRSREVTVVRRPFGAPLAAAGMGSLYILPVGIQGNLGGPDRAGGVSVRPYSQRSSFARLLVGNVLLNPPAMPSVTLTLHAGLSLRVWEALRATGYPASAVVMHVPDGELWAVVDYPAPDVNGQEMPDAAHSLKSFLPVNLPASTMKAITGACLLERHGNPDAVHWCGGRPCWTRHGRVSGLTEAICASCNCWFAAEAAHLNRVEWKEFLVRISLAPRPIVGIPDSGPGIVLPSRPGPGVYWAQAVGQQMYVSLPGLCAAYATITDGEGRRVEPSVVLAVDGKPLPPQGRPVVVRSNTTAIVRAFLAENGRRGTAAVINRVYRGADAGGKTGTAEREGSRDDAVFVAVAPARSPRWVVAVVLRGGGHGVNAGQVAGEILNLTNDVAP